MALDPHGFQEVTHQSWFSRIGGALKGVIFGLIVFVISFPLLFWNEGRAVERYKTLVEGAGAVVSIDVDTVDAANDGALVHASGTARNDVPLRDVEFGVSAPGLKLRRNAQMYQWTETSHSEERKKVGGGTETVTDYQYDLVWDDSLIDSSNFRISEGHQNPSSMLYETREVVADGVSFGAFTLARSQVAKMSGYQDMPLGPETPTPTNLGVVVQRTGSGYYIGDPAAPQVGDMRISYSVVPSGDYSIIATQTASTFAPYRASAGGTLELVAGGVQSAEAMFETAQAQNTALTWGLRVFGFLLMFMGLGMILRPLSVLADVIPILGNIVAAGTGLIAGLMAAVLSLLTISVAWLFYRPLLGVTLLAVAVALTLLIRSKLRD